MLATPPCAACGLSSTCIELVALGERHAQWEQWGGTYGLLPAAPQPTTTPHLSTACGRSAWMPESGLNRSALLPCSCRRTGHAISDSRGRSSRCELVAARSIRVIQAGQSVNAG